MGQKRKFLKKVKEIIVDHPADCTYVDLFGGSGLLSHTIKKSVPTARVIYNDFDNYRERLANIKQTNALLHDIRQIVTGLPKDKKIGANERCLILDRVRREEIEKGYVDFITVSSSILFSMKYVTSMAELERETLYNVVRESDYDATGYLDGVEIECMDYKAMFEKYKGGQNVVWLVDPPYLSTETGTYKSSYWKLKDYLDVLNVLDGTNYLYFTSNKSQIVELCEWIETRTATANPFYGATTSTMAVQMNHSAKYTDMLLFKYDFKEK
ncbi:Site-specific DNA-adenine methylase [Flavobacterium caeni]|uniref:site-specific DNA-methyltransferase (adenine-specific) n=2 Tax=Flavobacterium caeni TaxID=490189 RepID=A0A1G5K2N7_9FLAO|nr:Site-specific DNA-adenine methylase [Flavobacterium caeni]